MEQFKDKEFKDIEFLISNVIREHNRQIKKWGTQVCSLFEWLAYLTEEVGELAEAISEYTYRGKPKGEIHKEAIQIATLALKIAEMSMAVPYDTEIEEE